MKALSCIIDKEVLIESEYQLLYDISCSHAEFSFAIKVSDVREYLEGILGMEGEEIMDCTGRTWIPEYDNEIHFLNKILKEAEDCEYIIIQFDYES